MKTKSEITFPYRLDPYYPDQFGRPNGKRPLVVVHGYSAQLHPMQWFMHLIADQLPEYAIYQYGFETFGGLISNAVSLEEAARILGSELIRVKREHSLADGVLFIGHSTGGLVARRCFVDYQSQLGRGSFVFLGTPHYGAEIADLKNLLTLAHREKQTRELAAGSDFIWRLNRDWARLNDGVVARSLSVVGTVSRTHVLGRLPKGKWVQSDGVVRTTSACHLPVGSETSMVVHVPLEHGALKNVAPDWRKLYSFRRQDLHHPPLPTRDLPFIAAIAFLRSLARVDDYKVFWEFVVDYLQEIERDYRSTLYMYVFHDKDANGHWVKKPDEEVRAIQQRIDDLEVPIHHSMGLVEPFTDGYLALPEKPTFEANLQQYEREVRAFWSAERRGSVLLRLDYLDTPPKPRLLDILDSAGASRMREVRAHPAASLRLGLRWLTLYVPELTEGLYKVVLGHGERRYEASIEVCRHFTALYEINGFTGAVENLGRRGVVEEVSKGYQLLSEVIANKQWDMDVDRGITIRELASTDE